MSVISLVRRARRQLAPEEGQVFVFVAVAMVALLAISLLVIDGGREFERHTQMQNAADEVALAAAIDLHSDGSCRGACIAALQTYAHANGIPAGTPIVACDATHTVNCYSAPYVDSQGPHIGEIQVTLQGPFTPFFGPVVANLLGGTIQSLSVSASAVALRTANPGDSGTGIYIYSSGDVILTGSAHVQEPIIAQGNLNILGGNAVVDALARLVAVGLSGTGTVALGGSVGDGPQTTLSAAMTNVSNSASVNTATGGFQVPGTVFVTANPASCTPSAPCAGDEWIQYGKAIGTQLQQLTRGYGGYNALPASAHLSNDTVDPRVADFWAPNGAPCSPPALPACSFWVKTVHTAVFSFAPPTFDVNTAYADADLSPSHGCDIGSVPAGFFGPGSTPTNPGPTTDLAPGTNAKPAPYLCEATDAGGNVVGEIGWGSKNGITIGAETIPAGELKVVGTVFLNANLTMSNPVIYQAGTGGAVLWTTGSYATSGSGGSLLANCGAAGGAAVACTVATWNPNQNLLGIVAHKVDANSVNCISMGGGSKFQGLLYADGGCSNPSIDVTGGAIFQALMIGHSTASEAAGVEIRGGSVQPAPTIQDLPETFPGGGSGSTSSLVQ